ENGRVVHRETFDEQADRADRTWGRYRRWALSPGVRRTQERVEAMRAREGGAARQRPGHRTGGGGIAPRAAYHGGKPSGAPRTRPAGPRPGAPPPPRGRPRPPGPKPRG